MDTDIEKAVAYLHDVLEDTVLLWTNKEICFQMKS